MRFAGLILINKCVKVNAMKIGREKKMQKGRRITIRSCFISII